MTRLAGTHPTCRLCEGTVVALDRSVVHHLRMRHGGPDTQALLARIPQAGERFDAFDINDDVRHQEAMPHAQKEIGPSGQHPGITLIFLQEPGCLADRFGIKILKIFQRRPPDPRPSCGQKGGRYLTVSHPHIMSRPGASMQPRRA